MAKIKHVGMISQRGKEFLKLFDKLTCSRSAWQVWEDLMTVMACSISNAVERTPDKFKRREEQYEIAIKNLGGVEVPSQIFSVVVMALEENPNQDFLGQLYMSLNLGNHWRGQFFTPYHVSELMAKLTIGEECQKEIEEKGYVSVCDSCVGAGAMLIAAATAFREYKINYQTSVVFVGQDIDPVVAKMAYIQLSLLGCPGYIIVGDSLLNPPTGHVLFPQEAEGQDLWIMPLFMQEIWEMYRTKELVLELFGGAVTTEKTVEKEHLNKVLNNKEVAMETSKEDLQTEIKKEAIINIKVEEIYQHPDNPRKNLGDLTELSESIKKNGVMQNLTVIPGHHITNEEWSEMAAQYKENPTEELRNKMNTIHSGEWLDEGYTLIIGHRRCAAAKLAGLTEVPCRIVEDMSQNEQVSTMLEENMQRNDLTIYEQAQGFQMMLDLGDTEEQIAEKTGFSKTTIRHRVNIAKLDQKELQKKEKDENFQLTLKDLYELEKINDIETRDKVLKAATDSRDLIWKAKQAVATETRDRNKKLFEDLFKKAGIKKAPDSAKEERYSGKWDILQSWELDKDAPKTLKKFKEDNIQWVVFWGNTIAVIVPVKKQKKELSKYEIKEKERTKAKKELKQKHKIMYAEIDRFLMGIIKKEIDPLKEDVELYKALIMATITANVDYYRSDLVTFYSGKGMYELEHDHPEEYKKFLEWEENLSTLHLAIAHMTSIKKCEMYNYNAGYRKESADRVKAIIDFLAKYGFSVSEEEQKMLDGTHELYAKEGGAE